MKKQDDSQTDESIDPSRIVENVVTSVVGKKFAANVEGSLEQIAELVLRKMAMLGKANEDEQEEVAEKTGEVEFDMLALFEEALEGVVGKGSAASFFKMQGFEELLKAADGDLRKNPEILQRLQQAASRFRNVTVRNTGPVVGRNDPCPCKSGKKYKKCCWGKKEKDVATLPSRAAEVADDSRATDR